MPKGVYKRDAVKIPTKLVKQSVTHLSKLRTENAVLKQERDLFKAKFETAIDDRNDEADESKRLEGILQNRINSDLDGLVTVTIGITRAGRSIQDAEFKVQTNEENFSLVVGKGGLVQTVITKF